MTEQVCKNCGVEIVELQGVVEGKKYWRHANGYQTCEQKPITRAEPSPEPEAAPRKLTGAELIAEERRRQIESEGWTVAHDDEHDEGQMAMAAACYASPVPIRAEMDIPCSCREAVCEHTFGRIGTAWRDPWPWDEQWDKRGKHSRLRQLAIAGALIAAEIDRLQRSSQPQSMGSLEGASINEAYQQGRKAGS